MQKDHGDRDFSPQEVLRPQEGEGGMKERGQAVCPKMEEVQKQVPAL